MRNIGPALLFFCIPLVWAWPAVAQIDPYYRNLLQIGFDQPLNGRGPNGVYLYYYLNNPQIWGTNIAMRAAVAPAYLDGELGFKRVLTPHTDFGIGIYGGAFSDDYYEVRQGHYLRSESFHGYGGGAAANIYQLINPAMLIPLNLVLRGGGRFTTYEDSSKTADAFTTPNNRITGFTRAGLRLGGKQPMLYPDLGFELSAWFERQWRSDQSGYGFHGDRVVEDICNIYWVFGGLSYAWTNIGHQASLAITAGGSDNADRFSAWRLGGVLPLVAEFPLELPGYYYQELTARRVVHFYGSYVLPLDNANRFQFRLEAASACLDYLPGFEQFHRWQTGAGGGVIFTPKSKVCRIVFRYGYGFDAIRDGEEGAHSVGLLLQYDFEQHMKKRRQKL